MQHTVTMHGCRSRAATRISRTSSARSRACVSPPPALLDPRRPHIPPPAQLAAAGSDRPPAVPPTETSDRRRKPPPLPPPPPPPPPSPSPLALLVRDRALWRLGRPSSVTEASHPAAKPLAPPAAAAAGSIGAGAGAGKRKRSCEAVPPEPAPAEDSRDGMTRLTCRGAGLGWACGYTHTMYHKSP